MSLLKKIKIRIKNKIIHELTKEDQRLKKEKLLQNPPLTDDYYLLDDVHEPASMNHLTWLDNLIRGLPYWCKCRYSRGCS